MGKLNKNCSQKWLVHGEWGTPVTNCPLAPSCKGLWMSKGRSRMEHGQGRIVLSTYIDLDRRAHLTCRYILPKRGGPKKGPSTLNPKGPKKGGQRLPATSLTIPLLRALRRSLGQAPQSKVATNQTNESR